MFGAGVPVCAVNYGNVLSELVHDGVNGCVFIDTDQLTSLTMELLFPALTDMSNRKRLSKGRPSIKRNNDMAFLASLMVEAIACVVSGAGIIPSVFANNNPASKHSLW